jgi:hypothetical protein
VTSPVCAAASSISARLTDETIGLQNRPIRSATEFLNPTGAKTQRPTSRMTRFAGGTEFWHPTATRIGQACWAFRLVKLDVIGKLVTLSEREEARGWLSC